MAKKTIFLLNVHYNGLIVIMKIQFALQIILFKEMVELTLQVLEVHLLDQLLTISIKTQKVLIILQVKMQGRD